MFLYNGLDPFLILVFFFFFEKKKKLRDLYVAFDKVLFFLKSCSFNLRFFRSKSEVLFIFSSLSPGFWYRLHIIPWDLLRVKQLVSRKRNHKQIHCIRIRTKDFLYNRLFKVPQANFIIKRMSPNFASVKFFSMKTKFPEIAKELDSIRFT